MVKVWVGARKIPDIIALEHDAKNRKLTLHQLIYNGKLSANNQKLSVTQAFTARICRLRRTTSISGIQSSPQTEN